MLALLAGFAADQGRISIGGAWLAERLRALQLAPLACEGRLRQRVGLEVVGDAVLVGDGAEVRALLEARRERERGDVFAGAAEGRVLLEERSGQQALFDVAHGSGGFARTRPFAAAATTASAGRSSQGIAA
jgi:hypothetical protein